MTTQHGRSASGSGTSDAAPEGDLTMLDTPPPPPVTKQACKAVNRHGKPCQAGVGEGADYCFQHDPARAEQAAAARKQGGKQGGKQRAKPAPAPPIDLSTPELQRRAIEQTIDRVRAGDEPLNTGRFVVYAVSLARPILEMEEMDARLRALEERMSGGQP